MRRQVRHICTAHTLVCAVEEGGNLLSALSDRLLNLFGALAVGTMDHIKKAAFDPTIPGGSETTAAIVVIDHATGLSIDELGRVLGLSHAGTVRLVDRLVAAGFAVRSKALRDRRAVALMLTEAGENRLSAMLQRRHETLAELLSDVSIADRLTLERIAETMLARMSDDAISALTICRLCDERRCYNCPMDAFRVLGSSTHRSGPPNQ